jgi:hypothetical protein
VRWPEPSRQPHTSASSCSRENDARARGEQRQQVELGRRQVHARRHAHAPRRGSISSAPTRTRRRGRRTPLDAPEQRAHAGDQFARGERLGDVVVGADREPDEHVGLLRPGREHQHGHRPVTLQAAADLEAVESGQHQVEHHEVGAHAIAQCDPVGTVVRDLDREALGTQPRGDRRGDHLLILDHADELTRHAAECVTEKWERCTIVVQIPCKSGVPPAGAGYVRCGELLGWLSVHLTLIRNATLVLRMAGLRCWSIRSSTPPARAPPSRTRRTRARTRWSSFPSRPEALVARLDAVLVTHLHQDHFDDTARRLLPREKPLLCQPEDEQRLQADGFADVRPVQDEIRSASSS